jgi:hypothetical protein
VTAPQTPTPLTMPGAQAGIAAVQAQGGPIPASAPDGHPPAPQPTPDSAPQPQQPAPQAQQPVQQPTGDRQPPWGDAENFDAERAWRLIENLRDELKTHKERTDPIVEEHEKQRRAALDDNQRLTEDLTNANTQLEAWRSNAVRATAESIASSRFIDGAAAVALAGDLTAFTGNGQVDIDKLTLAFDEVAAKHPALVAQQQPRGFGVNRGQGASGTPVTAAQVAKHAESQRDWQGSLLAKAQQLTELPRQ